MIIMAHRGYWETETEKNSLTALQRALSEGYGFESDIRDYAKRLVISHNIADVDSPDAETVFRWLFNYQDQFCFAINIKADGLGSLLSDLLEQYHITNYFAFDMSVPQMIEYVNRGITCFTRQSEVETEPVLYEKAAGVWIDGFWGTDWITESLLQNHIANEKTVCLVSPELHGREHLTFWKQLAEFKIDFSRVMLCTDKPVEAANFFARQLERGA